jgi:hypothetical protein
MKPFAVFVTLFLGLELAASVAGAVAADPPKEGKADARAEATAAATRTGAEFTPPPGFKRMKRGKFVLYCKRDNALGTRIKTLECYDEDQMRNYMLALKETRSTVDRIRSTCSNVCVCGSPESC